MKSFWNSNFRTNRTISERVGPNYWIIRKASERTGCTKFRIFLTLNSSYLILVPKLNAFFTGDGLDQERGSGDSSDDGLQIHEEIEAYRRRDQDSSPPPPMRRPGEQGIPDNLNRLPVSLEKISHLSNATSNCKQICMQVLTPFSDTVFHALSPCGVVNFVQIFSPRTAF